MTIIWTHTFPISGFHERPRVEMDTLDLWHQLNFFIRTPKYTNQKTVCQTVVGREGGINTTVINGHTKGGSRHLSSIILAQNTQILASRAS